MPDLHLPHAGAGESAHPPHALYEKRDVDVGGVFGFGVGLAVVTFLISVAVWGLFTFFAARAARQVAPQFPLAVEQQNRLPPEPRLQTDPRQDLIDLRAHEAEILHSYGWVDRNAGIVRIPIDQAIKTTLERGLPTRQQPK